MHCLIHMTLYATIPLYWHIRNDLLQYQYNSTRFSKFAVIFFDQGKCKYYDLKIKSVAPY